MSLLDALQNAGLIDFSRDSSRPIPSFGDPGQEYQAAWKSAAIVVEHGFGVLTVTGEDRAKFLNNFCSNEINKLQPGDCCEAFFCNVKGRILALAVIICEQDRLLVLTDESRVEFLHQHLDRYVIVDDVAIALGDDRTNLLLAIGKPGTIDEILDGTESITVAAWDSGIRLTRWLVGSTEALVTAAEHCVERGAVIAGHQAYEVSRISAAYPKYGVDISDDNLAQEANRTEKAISFVKGCYLGQEPIARLDAMGHVNRQLERLNYESNAPLPVGSKVKSSSEDEFGTITSSSLIPGTNRGVALAMLKVKAAQADELVAVAEDDTTTSVELFHQ